MLPILSCTFRRFGHRTEETSSCPVWDSGAATGSLAHQLLLTGLLQFVLSHGVEADRCLVGLQRVDSGPCAEGIPGEHPPHLQPLLLGALLLPWHLSLWTIAKPPPSSLLPPLPSPPPHILRHTPLDGTGFHIGPFKLFRQSLQTLGRRKQGMGWVVLQCWP